MRLTGIGVDHFRSLYSADLALKPLTLIIGPNGSGKSNLFKALRFLQAGVAGDIQEWKNYEAEVDDLPWYGLGPTGARPESFGIALSFEGSPIGAMRYQTRFNTAGSLKVGSEFIQWSDGTHEFRDHFPQKSSKTLGLRDFGSYVSTPSGVFYQHIAGWRIFEAFPRLARQSQFIAPDPDEIPPLEPDASNLSAFLYALHRLRPDDLEEVLAAVRRSIDLPQDILIEHDGSRGGRQARYRFIENAFGADRPIPPESMSDGTIRLLAQMALLLADRSATLIGLEEPDSGLHPSLMPYLADALRQALRLEIGEGLTRQAIVVTHSPELMDCFDLAEEADSLQVYVTERDERGQTLFTPMDAERFAPWLEKYRLGEAVRRRFV
ncbi:MAG TPA: AAA family ATPase [Thermoanaerobaculia bacterium]|nr:AAA family ATPase [Thermoanaerobaculia bacterium]